MSQRNGTPRGAASHTQPVQAVRGARGARSVSRRPANQNQKP
jgi:hypothetical protein